MRGPAEPPAEAWAGVREALAADVRRVSDRLRSLSATRLASPPGPSADQGPTYVSRAEAGRAAAAELARAAAALEAASAASADEAPGGPAGASADEAPGQAAGEPASGEAGRPPVSWQVPDLPVLSDLAVGDQVAVTGHDLLAALDAVSPVTPVRTSTSAWTSTDERRPTAEQTVRAAARVLTDVRRRL